MTTAAGGKPLGPVWRFLKHISHFEARFVLATLPLMVASQIFRDTPVVAWLGTLGFLCVYATWIGHHIHDRYWDCDYCVRHFPLDAAAEAARKERWLRAAHMRRQIIIAGGVAAILMIAGQFVLPIIGIVATLAIYLGFGALAHIRKQHNRLGPWCPICRRDGGGHHEHVPIAPEPVPSGKVDA